MKNEYAVFVHAGNKSRVVFEGLASEPLMYSHVNTIEWTLQLTGGTAEIEIKENGQSRWIEYKRGRRVDL